MWTFKRDKTKPVVSACDHAMSKHGAVLETLPKTAILFYFHGMEYVNQNYPCTVVTERLPRFMHGCPVYKLDGADVCFLDGGISAPQAADTLETLKAFGVKNVLTVGLFGAFSDKVTAGETVVVEKAFVEEGTSLHYYKRLKCALPCAELLAKVDGVKRATIVSTDAFYRETYFKEKLWRKKGAVGVDMETSALYSVGKYLGLNVVSVLMVSDVHPMSPTEPHWQWTMTQDLRDNLCKKAVETALKIAKN